MPAGFVPSTSPQRAACAALALLLSSAWLIAVAAGVTHVSGATPPGDRTIARHTLPAPDSMSLE